MRSIREVRLSFLIAAAVAMLSVLPVAAVASSGNLSHSYESNTEIPNGSIVSLDPKNSNTVVLATTANVAKVVGISVASGDSLLEVDAAKDKVQVATTGTVNTLASDLNGDIKVGDEIAVSPFKGIGMKASPGERVIGLSQTDLTHDSEGASLQTVTDVNHHSKEVAIGYVSLSISFGADNSAVTGVKLNSLQRIAKSLTGHTISTVRVVISLGVAIIASLALITLIYASIYGSIISIGRNPMAKFAIFRTLSSVLAMAVIVALLAGTTIFLILR